MFSKVKSFGKKVVRKAKAVAASACAVALTIGVLYVASTPSNAHAALPDLGIDFSTMVSDMATQMGTYIAAVVGLAAAGIAALIGLRWLRRAG